MKKLSILVPVFNEVDTIPIFFERISKVFEQIKNQYEARLIFINNCSIDLTYEAVQKLRLSNESIYILSLTKNVGYQRSLECGLLNCDSDIYVLIDVDCEDPPEMILDFLDWYKKGYEIVYGERVDRHEHIFIKSLRNLFYRIAHRVADEEVILYMAEFSLFTKEVRDAIVCSKNSFPFIRNSIARVGFDRVGIPYKRDKRVAGRTNYNFYSMFLFALSGILSSSTLPLRLPLYTFPVWFGLACFYIFSYINQANPLSLFLFIASVFLYFGLSIGFISIYVARIYKNSLGYPNAFVHKKLTHMPNP